MSMPEAPILMSAVNGTLPPMSEPEIIGSNARVPSMAQRRDIAAELRKTCMELDETKMRLLHTRICFQSAAQSSQTLRQGLDTYQQLYIQLAAGYKATFEEFDREITGLREGSQIDAELIASQKQLLELYQSQQQQQQQQVNSVMQGGPLLSQYADHDKQCHLCSPYRSSGNDEFMDPATFRPGNDFDCNMLPSEPPDDPEPVIPPPVIDNKNRIHNLPVQSILNPVSSEVGYNTEQVIAPPVDNFGERFHNLSVQAGLHPISAERETANHYENEMVNNGPEKDGLRPNKKRKIR